MHTHTFMLSYFMHQILGILCICCTVFLIVYEDYFFYFYQCIILETKYKEAQYTHRCRERERKQTLIQCLQCFKCFMSAMFHLISTKPLTGIVILYFKSTRKLQLTNIKPVKWQIQDSKPSVSSSKDFMLFSYFILKVYFHKGRS